MIGTIQNTQQVFLPPLALNQAEIAKKIPKDEVLIGVAERFCRVVGQALCFEVRSDILELGVGSGENCRIPERLSFRTELPQLLAELLQRLRPGGCVQLAFWTRAPLRFLMAALTVRLRLP